MSDVSQSISLSQAVVLFTSAMYMYSYRRLPRTLVITRRCCVDLRAADKLNRALNCKQVQPLSGYAWSVNRAIYLSPARCASVATACAFCASALYILTSPAGGPLPLMSVCAGLSIGFVPVMIKPVASSWRGDSAG